MTAAFNGQTVLVTGASRGFGYAAARAFAASGAHVIAVARTVGGLEDLDDEIQKAGGSATLVPLDICDDDGLSRMGAALFERFGKVDIWLHTACHAPPLSPAEHVDGKDLDKTVAINIRAFQRLIRVVDPLLRLAEAPRAIIASDPRDGDKFFGAYGASKAAQSSLARSWANESGARIEVIEHTPPPMPTALRARFFPGEDRSALTPCETAAASLIESLMPSR
ncbi:SDR family oxidoreductase [Rhodobacteraceae bacterium NNCM2]|nr:SDR family oxidoreductase [Coraliihabitans acroporae]